MGLFGKRGNGSKRHKLGFTAGVVIEDEAGRATFVPASGSGTFTVEIAAVRRFVIVSASSPQMVGLRVLGDGVDLVEVEVPATASAPLQEWFRSHELYAGA